MKIVAVVQARTGSTRFPGKVLLPLAGRPLLERMLERVCAAASISEVRVATTLDASDDAIPGIAEGLGLGCYRGDTHDLLDRHWQTGLQASADVVVKIPSDCPLIDPAVIDNVVGVFTARAAMLDFVSNLHPPTFPDGNDVEVIPMPVLETAWREAHEDYQREHTTPFIWEQPSRFRLANVAMAGGVDCSRAYRWTIDYLEDYALIAAVYEILWRPERLFTMDDILTLLAARPELRRLNANVLGRGWYADRLAGRTVTHRAGTRP